MVGRGRLPLIEIKVCVFPNGPDWNYAWQNPSSIMSTQHTVPASARADIQVDCQNDGS